MEFLHDYPILLAVAIFLARIADVSLGTVRTILVFRSRPYVAAMIGFLEVLIWITAASQVLKDLSAWYLAVGYAGGFATGNIVGVWLEARLALGLELVRAVSSNLDVDLAGGLRAQNYSVVELDATSDYGGPIEVIYVVEKRRRVAVLLERIHALDPSALCTVSDVKRHSVLAMDQLSKRDGVMSIIKKK